MITTQPDPEAEAAPIATTAIQSTQSVDVRPLYPKIDNMPFTMQTALSIISLSALAMSAPFQSQTLTTSIINTNALSKRTSCPGPSAVILLKNQDAHTSVESTICIDNLADDIPTVFSSLDSSSTSYYVTSAHLVSFTEGFPAFCSFQSNINGDMFGRVIESLPDLKEWGTLNWTQGMVNLGSARIQCHVDREEYMGCLGIAGDVYTECLAKVTEELNGGGEETCA